MKLRQWKAKVLEASYRGNKYAIDHSERDGKNSSQEHLADRLQFARKVQANLLNIQKEVAQHVNSNWFM